MFIRRFLAIAFALTCIGTVAWVVFISYQEETTDSFLNFGALHSSAVSYIVSILAVDEVAGKARANVQLTIDRFEFVELPNIKGPINGRFLMDELEVRVGPLQTTDLAPTFEGIGFLALKNFDPILASPAPNFTAAPPPVSEAEFTLIGDSKLYPFDRYIVIGRVSSVLFASPNKKDFSYLDSSATAVYLRAPNFVMTGASNRELLARERFGATPEGLKLEEQFLKDHPDARRKVFAVLLQRPFFLKALSIFLLVITVGSAIYYAFVSAPILVASHSWLCRVLKTCMVTGTHVGVPGPPNLFNSRKLHGINGSSP